MDRGFFLGVEVFDWLFSGGLALLVSVGGRAVFAPFAAVAWFFSLVSLIAIVALLGL